MSIRLACPADAERMPDVELSAGDSFLADPAHAAFDAGGLMPPEVHARHIAGGTAWVAEPGDRLIGFLSAERYGDALHIWELAVRQECQCAGIGQKLMATALAWAKASAIAEITLTTYRDVPWNAPWYRRLGFAEVAEPDTRLAAVLARERQKGLPVEHRLAMRLAI